MTRRPARKSRPSAKKPSIPTGMSTGIERPSLQTNTERMKPVNVGMGTGMGSVQVTSESSNGKTVYQVRDPNRRDVVATYSKRIDALKQAKRYASGQYVTTETGTRIYPNRPTQASAIRDADTLKQSGLQPTVHSTPLGFYASGVKPQSSTSQSKNFQEQFPYRVESNQYVGRFKTKSEAQAQVSRLEKRGDTNVRATKRVTPDSFKSITASQSTPRSQEIQDKRQRTVATNKMIREREQKELNEKIASQSKKGDTEIKTYHLRDKKTGNVVKYWVYGSSPEQIRKEQGTWDARQYALVPTNIDTTSGIKKYLREQKQSSASQSKQEKERILGGQSGGKTFPKNVLQKTQTDGEYRYNTKITRNGNEGFVRFNSFIDYSKDGKRKILRVEVDDPTGKSVYKASPYIDTESEKDYAKMQIDNAIKQYRETVKEWDTTEKRSVPSDKEQSRIVDAELKNLKEKNKLVAPFEKDTWTEKDVKLALRRVNDKKLTPTDIFKANKSLNDGEGVALTQEQQDKGLKYLRNQWKSPTGKERVNNPFREREEAILSDPDAEIRLKDFYPSRSGYYYPVYEVVGDDTSMEYYVEGGQINIVG